jgi:methyl-accepting chemotaxis protein
VRITQSMLNILGRLRLWQKFALLVAAMAVPAGLLGCFYFNQATAQLRQARTELDGVRYLKALGRVNGEMLTHGGRAYAFLSGDTARRADVISQAEEVDRQIASVDSLDAQLGGRFGVSQAWQSVKSRWAALNAQTFQQAADENDAAHGLLADDLAKLAQDVGAVSTTSFDPEQNSRSLARVASDYAPTLLRYAVHIRQHAVRAASVGNLAGDDRLAIQFFHDRQLMLMGSVSAAIEQMPADTRAILQPAIDLATSTLNTFYALLQTRVLNPTVPNITGGALYDAGVPTNRALKQVSLASYDALTATIGQRLSALSHRRTLTALITGLNLALALILSWLIHRALSKPLTRAVAAFARVSAGKYDNLIASDGTDEAGQLLHALDTMQTKLSTQFDAERAIAAENSRIRQALDKASTSILLADAQHRIIYLNDTAQESFTRGQPEIRKSLQNFDAQQLRGSSLEALTTDPAAHRRALDALTVPEVQERALGAYTFRTVSSPVLNEQGQRIGTVVEWTDRTHEIAVEKEMQRMLSAVVGGDLVKRIDLKGKSAFLEATGRGVNQLADNIAEIVAKVKQTSGEIYRGSQEISTGNSHLQKRTEEQSASLEETASSMEEMTATVKQNADNAGHANQLAVAAREQAEQGGAVVGKAVSAMADINQSAARIAAIIGVIDEIAFQTNLLALNAAVEAARAGEQGRGFAVVASEVRSLASRSATAAKQIKELIQDSMRKVEDGSVLVTRSGQTLEQIVASVKKVSDIVAEIAAASREQSAGIAQVNRAVLQMDELTQQNSSLVGQAAGASRVMADEAHALHDMMGGYGLGESAGTGSTGPQPVLATPPADPDPSAAQRAERRSPTRPWSAAQSGSAGQNPLRLNMAAAEREAAVMPDPLAAGGPPAGDESEWQEF